MGADREGRTLWVWLAPFSTVVVTFLILAFLGVAGKVDLALTIPMALTLSLFLGTLSAFYLTAASADERDADEDPPDNRHRPPAPAPAPQPPPGATARPAVTPPAPVPEAAPQEERVPAGSRR